MQQHPLPVCVCDSSTAEKLQTNSILSEKQSLPPACTTHWFNNEETSSKQGTVLQCFVQRALLLMFTIKPV